MQRQHLWHRRVVQERMEVEARRSGKPLEGAVKRLMKTLDVPGRKKTGAWGSIWEEVVGPELAAQTQVILFKNGVLQIRVPNAALKSELENFHKDILLNSLQEKEMPGVLRDLSFRM